MFSGSLDAKVKVLSKPPRKEVLHVFNVSNSVHSLAIFSSTYLFAGLATGKVASLDLQKKFDLVDLELHF